MKSIALFDSGLGGLTVLKEAMQSLPNEHFLYFGDTARVPYGNKSCETIISYALEIAEFLQTYPIKLLVVCCNTASVFALEALNSVCCVPVIGVLNPGAQAAATATKNGKIGVLGTKSTIFSGAYQKILGELAPACTVTVQACPLFVPLVEEGLEEHPAAELFATEYLRRPLDAGVDTLLLGCTHYPLLMPLLKKIVGEKVQILDSAAACALQIKGFLTEREELASKRKAPHQFFVSDDPEGFRLRSERFLNAKIAAVDAPSPSVAAPFGKPFSGLSKVAFTK